MGSPSAVVHSMFGLLLEETFDVLRIIILKIFELNNTKTI